jgi:hypothetical protein
VLYRVENVRYWLITLKRAQIKLTIDTTMKTTQFPATRAAFKVVFDAGRFQFPTIHAEEVFRQDGTSSGKRWTISTVAAIPPGFVLEDDLPTEVLEVAPSAKRALMVDADAVRKWADSIGWNLRP